jgi:metal-responsive CopG/Arc/MetJ family transcriptional regulator
MVMARRQTLVQLSDALLEELDRHRGREGRSRSEVIREAVERYLEADREAEVDRRIVAAYTREPQREAWGDSAAEWLVREEPW